MSIAVLNWLVPLAFIFGSGSKDLPETAEGKRFIKKVELDLKKQNLRSIECRGHYNSDIISFSLGFGAREDDIGEMKARKMFVEMAERIYQMINSEKTLIPFLRHFPYDEKTGYLALTFQDKNGEQLPPSKISCVSLYKGIIEYSKRNENGFEGLFRENYSTAYEKVMGKPLVDRRVMYGIEAAYVDK